MNRKVVFKIGTRIVGEGNVAKACDEIALNEGLYGAEAFKVIPYFKNGRKVF